ETIMFVHRMLAGLLAGFGFCIATAMAAGGVTATTVTVGQSAALAGPAAELGNDMRKGILAYFDAVNRAGGVNGRKLVLKSLDDGYEATRAAANTKQLIQEDVFALLGYVGTPTSEAAKPIFTEARMPFVGAFTGAELLRAPFNRYIFNVRASYYAETEAIVNLIAKLDMKRIAVFYQNDSYGKAGLSGVEKAMTARGMKVIAMGTVERNSVDVAAAVKEIAAKDPQAVVMISAYKSCAAFIREMKTAKSNPQFMNVSFVGSKALATELGDTGRGVAIAQVVPFPWNAGLPVVKDYQKSMTAAGNADGVGFGTLEGYIAARVLVEGLRRAGPNPTREGLIAGLETLRDFDVGGFYVTYTPSDHNGSKFVELTVIGREGRFLH
ncbi:MAG: ABC transporter substrate-binding protein, partial [Casimicrobiaceae bacterium]